MNIHDYMSRKYRVSSYDPEWPITFKVEAGKLKDVFKDEALSIEHIGSTAVPGLDSKPTIDILITINDIAVVDSYVSKMESLGYKYLGEYVKPESRLFIKERPDNADRIFNVHVFPAGHPHVKDMINLRDYFRTHPNAVKEYSNLKRELVSKYPDDYGQYRKFKDEWMEELKSRVLKTEWVQ